MFGLESSWKNVMTLAKLLFEGRLRRGFSSTGKLRKLYGTIRSLKRTLGWLHVFAKTVAATVLIILKCDPHTTNLILTEAPNTPVSLQTNCDQMIFEEYEFASYSRCLGP